MLYPTAGITGPLKGRPAIYDRRFHCIPPGPACCTRPARRVCSTANSPPPLLENASRVFLGDKARRRAATPRHAHTLTRSFSAYGKGCLAGSIVHRAASVLSLPRPKAESLLQYTTCRMLVDPVYRLPRAAVQTRVLVPLRWSDFGSACLGEARADFAMHT